MKKMDEKTRVKKFLKSREEFSWIPKSKGIKLIKEFTLKDVTCDFDYRKFKKLKCYLYHFNRLGITNQNIMEEFEDKTILIYKMVPKKTIRRSKCPWCYAPVEDLVGHIAKAHNKTLTDINLLDFQKDLYKELLKIIRDTDYYMSTMFINAGCKMCDNPIMEGRELCCSIPTSFRDRVRSLKIMGVSSTALPEKYVQKANMGQIILAP